MSNEEIKDEPTFRTQYKQQKRYAFYFLGMSLFYVACSALLVSGWGAVLLFAASVLSGLQAWLSYDKMKKAKRYIVFDDFLKTQS